MPITCHRCPQPATHIEIDKTPWLSGKPMEGWYLICLSHPEHMRLYNIKLTDYQARHQFWQEHLEQKPWFRETRKSWSALIARIAE
jgi:hypothetical protein